MIPVVEFGSLLELLFLFGRGSKERKPDLPPQHTSDNLSQHGDGGWCLFGEEAEEEGERREEETEDSTQPLLKHQSLEMQVS